MCADDGVQLDFDIDELDKDMEKNLQDIYQMLENHKNTQNISENVI